MVNETGSVQKIGPLFVRVQPPQEPGRSELLVLLHGWTGNENVMWVFTRHFPKKYWILAPRALYPAEQGGFRWTQSSSGMQITLNDLHEGVEAILAMIAARQPSSPVDRTTFSLMGFSQGAALAYTLALLHPDRIRRLAGLAGFLPAGAEQAISSRPLAGKHLYVAHGTKDDRVPVERARQTVQLLVKAGAKVDYCESEVGHKLSLDCLKGLESYFGDSPSAQQRD
ncbi:MAG TPA: dienelactone hydrolase family protein [Anaerolineaceae bacterium]|nr:dienelactone hydrolase family protein [Anaerolineaceae bacterium]